MNSRKFVYLLYLHRNLAFKIRGKAISSLDWNHTSPFFVLLVFFIGETQFVIYLYFIKNYPNVAVVNQKKNKLTEGSIVNISSSGSNNFLAMATHKETL